MSPKSARRARFQAPGFDVTRGSHGHLSRAMACGRSSRSVANTTAKSIRASASG